MREVLDIVGINARDFSDKWYLLGENGDMVVTDHRLVVLLRELGELSNSVYGKHEHSPELELIQIAGIAVNWLNQFPIERVRVALEQIKSEHGKSI